MSVHIPNGTRSTITSKGNYQSRLTLNTCLTDRERFQLLTGELINGRTQCIAEQLGMRRTTLAKKGQLNEAQNVRSPLYEAAVILRNADPDKAIAAVKTICEGMGMKVQIADDFATKPASLPEINMKVNDALVEINKSLMDGKFDNEERVKTLPRIESAMMVLGGLKAELVK